MVGGENENRSAYLTEDIVINVLLRLTVASCIARFRCVCRSWRNLLSDPNFIRKILFVRNADEEKALRVLVTGYGSSPYPIYSLYSFETLSPIQGYGQPSLVPPVGGKDTEIRGICDGIICMAYIDKDAIYGAAPCNIILWNPATSESKILPPCPGHPVCSPWQRPLVVGNEYIGFGFDPQTKDYKVIRVLDFHDVPWEDDNREYHFEPSQIPTVPWNPFFVEVYSLKNDSWKTLNLDCDTCLNLFAYSPESVQQYTSRNDKCYWYRGLNLCGGVTYRAFGIISFDMSDEVFESVAVAQPALMFNQQDDGGSGDRPAAVDTDTCAPWSCFMLKGVFVVTWWRYDYEIWGLLKHGVAESWTKFLSFPRYKIYIENLEVWKDGIHIARTHDGTFTYDLETGTVIRPIKIEGSSIRSACVITPTQVSLSLAG